MESQQEAQPDYAQVEFNGNTSDYFSIWIVNLALTIVTLGVYSAWAKVRKERYFYTHTSLAGGSFDYHAKPKAILLGRIIAVLMLGIYLSSSYIDPIAPFVVIVLIFLIAPWLLVRSRIFRMRVSSYRGIRFDFKRNYAEAFKVYYLSGLVILVSFGLASATSNFMRNKFAVNQSGFGQTDFKFNGEHSAFVGFFWKSIGLTFLLFIAFAIFAGVFSAALVGRGNEPPSQMTFLLLNLPLFAGYIAIGVYYQVRLRNYIWNSATLGENHFLSTLSVREMIGIYLTNLLAIIFSLGLLIPWAQIRLAKYRADHLAVWLMDDWEKYLAASGTEGSAIGDEVGEAFDVDIDLGF
jgi:uncharacterized membrane protein YjgN (DUF898 family)